MPSDLVPLNKYLSEFLFPSKRESILNYILTFLSILVISSFYSLQNGKASWTFIIFHDIALWSSRFYSLQNGKASWTKRWKSGRRTEGQWFLFPSKRESILNNHGRRHWKWARIGFLFPSKRESILNQTIPAVLSVMTMFLFPSKRESILNTPHSIFLNPFHHVSIPFKTGKHPEHVGVTATPNRTDKVSIPFKTGKHPEPYLMDCSLAALFQ